MKHTTFSVDIAKNVFEIAVSYEPGIVRESHRVARAKLLEFFAKREKGTVVMEACSSSHFWGREVEKVGHRAVLLPPHAVRPYVQRNKTDRADAKGILEAYRNKEIRPVPVKTVAQHTVTALHRMRSMWLEARTSRLNTLRGLLREIGIFIPVGAKHVVPRVSELVEDADSDIPNALRAPLHEMCLEIRGLESRMRQAERELEALARQMPVVVRLRDIPGVGLLTATALVAFVGDVQRFRSGDASSRAISA
jgi:transposase